MIPIKMKLGETRIVGESYCPIPHSITKSVHKSGNYGLADAARLEFREMKISSRGRGRRNPPKTYDYESADLATIIKDLAGKEVDQAGNLIDVDKPMEQIEVADEPKSADVAPVVPRPTFENAAAKASTGTKTAEPFQGRPNPFRLTIPPYPPKPKQNGYVMFLQYMKRKSGVQVTPGEGSVNDLMRIFDKDWKELPDEEKKIWRDRAKITNLGVTIGDAAFSNWKGIGSEKFRNGTDSPSSSSHGYSQRSSDRRESDSDAVSRASSSSRGYNPRDTNNYERKGMGRGGSSMSSSNASARKKQEEEDEEDQY